MARSSTAGSPLAAVASFGQGFEGSDKRSCELGRVATANVAMTGSADHLLHIADIHADNRKLAGHRLLDHVWRPFAARREDQDISCAHPDRHLARLNAIGDDEPEFGYPSTRQLNRRPGELKALRIPRRIRREKHRRLWPPAEFSASLLARDRAKKASG